MTPDPEASRSHWPMIAVFVAVIVLIVTFVAGVHFSSTSETANDESGLVTIDAQELLIDISDYKFHPPNVSIPRGATVTWTNDDAVQHTSTEKTAGAWDTQVIHEGESVALKFTTPGTFQYYCTIHPYMTGAITVR